MTKKALKSDSGAGVVGVMLDGEPTFHAGGVCQDYHTLCAIDANDPEIGHGGTIHTPTGQKITCQQCKSIWENTIALKLKQSDFSKAQK